MAQEITEFKKVTEDSYKIALLLKEAFPEQVLNIDEIRGQVIITVTKEKIKDILRFLKERQGFNHLQDLCGVDYYPNNPRFEVVFSLFSIWKRLHIRVKAKIPEEEPEIDSVTDLWMGADWHERECYDMFGIKFKGHHFLKRILMPEDWNGHPLRKDYPLKGKELWRGFREIIDFQPAQGKED
jgi:NADH-quinone oxidoreductase subunit C